MPAVSRVIRDEEDEPVVNFVLQQGVVVAGVAYLPDKTPLSGADVVLVMPSQPAFIKNGRAPDSIQHCVVKTGANGRFTFRRRNRRTRFSCCTIEVLPSRTSMRRKRRDMC